MRRGDYVCIAKGWYLPEAIFEKYKKYFSSVEKLSQNEEEFQTSVNKNFVGHPILNKEIYKSPILANTQPDFVEEYFNNIDAIKAQRVKLDILTKKEGELKRLLRQTERTNKTGRTHIALSLIKESGQKIKKAF